MYTTLISVALLFATAVTSVVAEMTMPTPQLTQCKPAQISWSPATGPYHLVVVSANDPCGDPILDLGEFDKHSTEWTVQLPAGVTVELYVEDSTTNDAWSGKIVVGHSDDQSCLPQHVRQYFNIQPATSSHSPSATHSDTVPHSLAVAHPSIATHSLTALSSPSVLPVVQGTTPVASLAKSTTVVTQETGIVPVGAANAGNNPFSNGALTMRQASTSVATMCALLAALAFAL
ncbi:hypothetical protein AX17_002358 [Amanita inopinata Kibby_2008]|nr:hypothetical protein AX17_002358 [Amanita inopinata Kibby_2008]